MIRPKTLKKGDTIGLVAPSGFVSEEGLKSSIISIESLGLEVELTESCFRKYGYLAGSDEVRAAGINELFANDNIDGIFCVRGGYGSQRILPMLDFEMIKRKPKFFAGFSDITALHIVFNQVCGFITYHSPMPAWFDKPFRDIDEFSKDTFEKCLFSEDNFKVIKNEISMPPIEIMHAGKAKGVLTGGNLSIIASSMGTEYEIDTKGKILFLEDVGEQPYSIDRMLVQLRNSGKLDDAVGFILGDFADCTAKNPSKSLTLNQVFEDIILPLKKPILYKVPCGHCKPTMTLPMGSIAEISLNGDISFNVSLASSNSR